MEKRRWNPWRELRDREHIRFRLARLPEDLDGVYWPRGGRAAVIIGDHLPRRERAAALAHELVHDERGGGCTANGMPPDWAPVVAREEARVERLVAERLVPTEELEDYIAVRLILGEPVEPHDVAEHFDVAESVVLTALRHLEVRRAS